MADFKSTVIIRRPVAEVFQYATNPDNAPEIMPNVVKMEKATDGPIGPSTRFIETRMIRGKKVKAEIEYTQFEQDKSYTAKSNSNGLVVTYDYTFTEIDEGTQVELEANIHTSGFIMSLTRPMLVKIIKKEDGRQLSYLKQMLQGDED
ncbi:SRPBCC family protein [Bacillus infantis]|uniref:SRPBCC family protein n=1 Tax=Bacillus infantis TaxID=324767 RepID=UPI0021554586|nr:SRPBCC family protein [Bacillus infantis]MCR6613135.1 SRPBCC family protein [Bacillus infantis]